MAEETVPEECVPQDDSMDTNDTSSSDDDDESMVPRSQQAILQAASVSLNPVPGHLCPSQPRYASQLLMALNDMRLKGEHCDVTLLAEGEVIPGHKAILAACSPYFSALFRYENQSMGNACSARNESEQSGASSDHPTNSDSVFEMKDVTKTVMDKIMNFIYTGLVDLSTEDVEDIMIAANMLQLLDLKEICADFLIQHLDVDNSFDMSHFGDMYSCPSLKKEADELISKRFHQVSQTEDYLNLDFESVHQLLERNDLKVKSEEQIFEAFIRWIKHDIGNRLKHAHILLKVIRIKLLSQEYIKEKMKENTFLWDDKDLSLVLLSYVAGMDAPSGDAEINPIAEVRAPPESIYAIGGRDSNRCLSTAERYNGDDGAWEKLPSMKQVRTAVGVAGLDGLLYAVGGECEGSRSFEPTQYLDTMEVYNPKNNTWDMKQKMNYPRSFAAVSVYEDKLYVMGGESHPACHTSSEMYDPKTEKWTALADMSTPRSGAGAAVLDNKIYIAGGHDRQTHHSSMECYDPHTNTWKSCANMNYSCSGIAITSLGKFLYAFGGRNRFAQAYYNKIQRYSPMDNRWEDIAILLHPRAWPAAAVYGGEVYIIGGYDGNQRLKTVEKFNPLTLKSSTVSPMNDYRAGVGAATL